jgi:hypothetical protein
MKRTCTRCGLVASCNCVWHSRQPAVCKQCVAAERRETLPLDVKIEIEAQRRLQGTK